ncbi:MAG: S8/S53 family peptidase [Candidatus Electryonea clarkiae]|nr:S8/S53 family peptidase [Candidatus Electryonea clarkiae]MDP8286700.1 S8/S53 family peptidase [Candidatus Electryonea clarkiae]
MKRFTIVLILLAFAGIGFSQVIPAAIHLELTDEAAYQIRTFRTIPQFILDLKLDKPVLDPIFYIPKDEEHREAWYELELNRWFVLRWEDNISTSEVAAAIHPGTDLIWIDVMEAPIVQRLPNDWNWNNMNMWGLAQMRCSQAWDIQTGNEEVIICTIDTGCEITHPDLLPNLWVNPGEDIDNDGEWTEDDDNHIDDDDNGFVDDIMGWDFVTTNIQQENRADGEDYGPADNDIYPDIHGHGTHVAGSAGAATNNGFGVSAASWNVTNMSLRAGYAYIDDNGFQGGGDSGGFMGAIQYATDNGARVISISFGGYGAGGGYQNAINYAREFDVLVFASAGNDGISNRLYPAAYNYVIAVAATRGGDVKSGYSNYGTWVDLAAPGNGIWSTMSNNRYHQANYAAWDGTSMASPNAASVAALVLSYNPDMSVGALETIMLEGCDNIDNINPNYRDELGAGRVNAYNSVILARQPEVTLQNWMISDENANHYGNPGESVELILDLINVEGRGDATDITASIDVDIAGVTYERDLVYFFDLASGENSTNEDAPLIFTIPDNIITTFETTITITIRAQPYDYEIVYQIPYLIGTPEVILVDDDGGMDLDSYIRNDLDSLGVTYFHHDISSLDETPIFEHLVEPGVIIWMTGDEIMPLSPQEIEVIETALDSGANLFMFGQTIDDQLSGGDFYSEYLHSASAEGSTGLGLEPVNEEGGPGSEEMQLLLIGSDNGAGNSRSPDVIEPANGGSAYFKYMQTESIGGVYYYGNTYKSVYFSFAFEAVTGAVSTTPRTDVISSILDWFSPSNNASSPIDESLPQHFEIVSAYPNPFNPVIHAKIALPESGKLVVEVFDLLGRRVTQLQNGNISAGYHNFSWNAQGYSTGLYFMKVMNNKGEIATEKIVLLK